MIFAAVSSTYSNIVSYRYRIRMVLILPPKFHLQLSLYRYLFFESDSPVRSGPSGGKADTGEWAASIDSRNLTEVPTGPMVDRRFDEQPAGEFLAVSPNEIEASST